MSEQAAAAEQTAMPKHGTFCWNELASGNVGACKQFYAELLGWRFKESYPMKDGEAVGMIYNEISVDGKSQFGGMFQMGREFGEMPSHWMSYVAVEDVDASAEKVTELGGKICVPPTDIPNTGRFCVINDPSGATISLITIKR